MASINLTDFAAQYFLYFFLFLHYITNFTFSIGWRENDICFCCWLPAMQLSAGGAEFPYRLDTQLNG